LSRQLRIGHGTDAGRQRERNEDAYRTYHGGKFEKIERGSLFAVADGIGGHKAGAEASKMAVDQLWLYFQFPRERFHASRTLEELVRTLNRTVYQAAQRSGSHKRMGCTLSTFHIDPHLRQGYAVHVGDSRIYRYNPKLGFRQVTVDHTDPVRAHELANHIGISEEIYIETSTWLLHSGDRWLLCTDGLTLGASNAEIEAVLSTEPDTQAAVDKLIDLANREGRDNITAVLIDVVDCALSQTHQAETGATSSRA
jgi:protein phosphatase